LLRNSLQGSNKERAGGGVLGNGGKKKGKPLGNLRRGRHPGNGRRWATVMNNKNGKHHVEKMLGV